VPSKRLWLRAEYTGVQTQKTTVLIKTFFFFSLGIKPREILVCKWDLKVVLYLGYVFYVDLFICYFDPI